MQPIVLIRSYIQQPVVPVLGLLIAAGAAKAGYSGWAAVVILAAVSIYFVVVAMSLLTRNLGDWLPWHSAFPKFRVLQFGSLAARAAKASR